jgi:3-oxoacyl-(acyl-carrier-protein) synthase
MMSSIGASERGAAKRQQAKSTSIGIRSIGVVAPGIDDLDALAARSFASRDEALTGPLRVSEEALESVGGRLMRRIDRFSALAIVAVERCLLAGIGEFSLTGESRERTGIVVGNNFGGWGYVEPMMRPLYGIEGMAAINPYVATAWFPAAAQGEISIRLGIKGHSKTFSAERLSSAFAIEYARDLLADGALDAVLAGGAEAPCTPIVLAAMEHAGLIAPGTPAGEAACFLLLSRDLDGALGSIDAVGRGPSCWIAMRSALDQAPGARDDLDLVVLDRARAHSADNLIEQRAAIRAVVGRDVPAQAFATCGETVGAAFALDVAIACAALRTRRRVLVNASDEFGQWMSVLVSSPRATPRFPD